MRHLCCWASVLDDAACFDGDYFDSSRHAKEIIVIVAYDWIDQSQKRVHGACASAHHCGLNECYFGACLNGAIDDGDC